MDKRDHIADALKSIRYHCETIMQENARLRDRLDHLNRRIELADAMAEDSVALYTAWLGTKHIPEAVEAYRRSDNA